MTWYEQWFDRDEYELVYRDRDEREAEDLIELILRTAKIEPEARVLDVGCGRGRHAIALATRGFRVTGLDLSKSALSRARARALEAGVSARFVQGDMRNAVDDGSFDLVVNLFTAFGYFDDRADHQRAVNAMVASLAPGGVLVQDFLNADRVRASIPPDDTRQVGNAVIAQRRWIEENRIKKEITITRGERSHAFVESVALLGPADFEALYAEAGLEIVARFGSYVGAPYDSTSDRLILFSRRTLPPQA